MKSSKIDLLGIMNPRLEQLFADLVQEIFSATEKYGSFNSAHEGYAVILEELDELKEHVWKKQELRDPKAMKEEAIQVAAMALRFAYDCCADEQK